MSGLWLIIAPLTPLVLALLWCVPALRMRVARLVPLAPLPALLMALFAPDTHLQLPWILFGAEGVLDELARTFLGFTAVLWIIAGLQAHGHGDNEHNSFWLFWLLTLTGNLGLILTRDIAGFYSAFALMTFAAYGLVIHNRDAEALRAGRVYLIMSVLGEALLLSGLVLTARHAEQPLMAELGPVIGEHSRGQWFGALLWLGFGVKAGLPLLHVWLALAHPVAPTPASAVLSGAMIKAGLLGWLLVLPTQALVGAGTVIMATGLLGAFGGALLGICQAKAKTVLAYSSISQMGLMTVMVGAAVTEPALQAWLLPAIGLYALHHGLAKGALFLGVGGLPLRRFPRAGWLLPALPGLALAGLPLTSGAAAKIAMKEALDTARAVPDWWALLPGLLGLAATGTTLLIARFLYCLYRDRERLAGKGDALPWPVIAATGVSLSGIWWLPHAQTTLGTGLHPEKLIELLWPLSAGALLCWLALQGGLRGPPVPAGDLVVPAERCAQRLLHGLLRLARLSSITAERCRNASVRMLERIRRAGYWLVREEESWRHHSAALFVVLALALFFVL